MNIQTLPTQFLLYNSSSKTARDRYAGFTLMTCTPSQLAQPSPYPKYNLENVPKQPANRIIQFQGKDNRWNMPAHPIGIANFSNPAHSGSVCITFSVYDMTDHFKAVEHVLMGNEMFAHPVPILFVSPSKHLVHDLFPPRSVKRNITIQMMCSSAVPPETPNMGIVIYMNPPMSVPPAIVPMTPAPTPTQPLPKPTIKKSTEGNTLCPFVVKKLLELAILTKQNTCPITLEELTLPTDGQMAGVAAMPCGHLFSEIAITESFRTLANRNVCPQCRTSGKPTLI
jgi:hypothetical protein